MLKKAYIYTSSLFSCSEKVKGIFFNTCQRNMSKKIPYTCRFQPVYTLCFGMRQKFNRFTDKWGCSLRIRIKYNTSIIHIDIKKQHFLTNSSFLSVCSISPYTRYPPKSPERSLRPLRAFSRFMKRKAVISLRQHDGPARQRLPTASSARAQGKEADRPRQREPEG